MTENMAGRGEGLAGLVAKWREAVRQMEKWPELQSDACVLKTCTEQLETALEAAAPACTAPRPYRALNEGGGCKECHHGNDWTVVYTPPDGSEEIGEGETWDNESPADEMAESLNDAFVRGWRAALATPSPQAPKWGAEIAARAEFGDLSPTSAREQSSATASVNLSTAETEQCNWRGVPWRATIEGTNLAEEIVRHFAHAATELLACRSGWVDEETTLQPSDESVKEAEEDLFNVLMGHDSGCLDPEDLDETNCSFNWAESKLHELLTAWLATKPVPAAAQEPAGSGASEQLLQDFNAQFGLGIFVVTGDHQRTAFFSKEKAEQYLAQQDPERFRIVVYPKPDGGSPRKVGEDGRHGQPSKLRPTYYVRHPDDTFSVADPQPVKEFKAILQQRIKDILAVRNEYEEGDTATSHCFHLMEVERILDGKSVGFGELVRPSSVPVGEQKQEEGV